MPVPDFDSANAGNAVVMGSHVIDFDYYWHLKQLYRNGQGITYHPSFKAAGCSWRFDYYPNGVSSSSKDYISIFVALDSRVSQPIKARSRFTLLDQNAEPVPGHSVYTDVMESSEVGATHGCDLFIRRKFLEASKCLLNGRFYIIWDVFVDWPPSLFDLFDTDVVIQVGGDEFSAHRSVLAARSPVFEAELLRATREDGGTTIVDCVQIADMLPDVFENLLHFAYTDSLPDMDGTQGPMMVEHLLVAADRFHMQELKLICEEKLCSNINEDTIANMLRFAEQHQCPFLRDACIEFLEDPPVLQAVMATDDDLLEVVAKSCPVLLKELWADEDDSMQDELAMCFTVSEEIC
ncbi:unnamed protein product [Urochloa humidicola]